MSRRGVRPRAAAAAIALASIVPPSQNRCRYVRARYFQELRHTIPLSTSVAARRPGIASAAASARRTRASSVRSRRSVKSPGQK